MSSFSQVAIGLMAVLMLAPPAGAGQVLCCEAVPRFPPPGPPIVQQWYADGTYDGGAPVYYGPRAHLRLAHPPYDAPVRIHGWPVCYWGSGNEGFNGYKLVGPGVGFCD